MTNDAHRRGIIDALLPASMAATHGIGVPPPPPPPHPGLPTFPLSQVFQRPTAVGLYFNGKEITLDGFEFEGCRFDNCILRVSSTNFELRNCIIDNATTIEYGSEAMKIVHLFNSRTDWYYQNLPHLAPVKHANGTISITGGRR